MGIEKYSASATVAERLRASIGAFKPAELKIAEALLANYPMAGMVSITELASRSGVSAPTVMRTLERIGYSSFPTFQKALKRELEQTLSSPIVKHDRWAADAPREHVLNAVADKVVENLKDTLQQLGHAAFDSVVSLLADERHAVHLVGGRITHSFADYLNTHLEVMRGGVFRLPGSSALWPHHLLKIEQGDTLVMMDVRRYEADLLSLAELASERGAVIVLFTDQWMSPIARHARHTFPVRIESRSGWDSGVATLYLIEALITGVEKALWPNLSTRMHELEQIFDYTGRFRRSRAE